MVLQNYQKFIVLTSNMVYIVALDVGFKCPHKIHLNTQWGDSKWRDRFGGVDWIFLAFEFES